MRMLESTIRRYLVIASILAILIGINFSDAPVLMSIGMIVLVANAVLNRGFPEVFSNLAGSRVSLYLISFFLLFVVSGFMSNNMDMWMWNVRLKLPFLLMPLAFVAIEPLDRRTFHGILYVFFWVVTLISASISVLYLTNFDAINEGYAIAKVMPTPVGHPRFSLIVGFAIVVGGYLYFNKYWARWKWERTAIMVVTLLLVVFLHSLAVRSGLFALYIVVAYLAMRYAFLKRKPMLAVGGLALIILLPIGAYFAFPTFKNKINYVRYDMQMYMSNKSTSDHSDGGRIISIKAGVKVGNQNPLFGVGTGDVLDEMKKVYASDYPMIGEGHRHVPHNLFATYYASFGILGLLWFLIVFWMPVFHNKGYRNPLLVGLSLILFTSFISESTFEGQVGTAFYLTFLLLILNAMKYDDQAVGSHHHL